MSASHLLTTKNRKGIITVAALACFIFCIGLAWIYSSLKRSARADYAPVNIGTCTLTLYYPTSIIFERVHYYPRKDGDSISYITQEKEVETSIVQQFCFEGDNSIYIKSEEDGLVFGCGEYGRVDYVKIGENLALIKPTILFSSSRATAAWENELYVLHFRSASEIDVSAITLENLSGGKVIWQKCLKAKVSSTVAPKL